MFFKINQNTIQGVGNNQGKVIFAGHSLVGGTQTIQIADGANALIKQFLTNAFWKNILYDNKYITRVETVPVQYVFATDLMISFDFTFNVRSSLGNRRLYFGGGKFDLSEIRVFHQQQSITTDVTTTIQLMTSAFTNVNSFFVKQNEIFALTSNTSTATNLIFDDSPALANKNQNSLVIRAVEVLQNMSQVTN